MNVVPHEETSARPGDIVTVENLPDDYIITKAIEDEVWLDNDLIICTKPGCECDGIML